VNKEKLLNHVISVHDIHDGLKFPWNQCVFEASWMISLLDHEKSVHEGMEFSCNQCEYKATFKTSLLNIYNLQSMQFLAVNVNTEELKIVIL